MEALVAAAALSALGDEGRLRLFRVLVQAGPRGADAVELARLNRSLLRTAVVDLGILSRAGLIEANGEGLSATYTVASARMADLVAFLQQDWAAGRP